MDGNHNADSSVKLQEITDKASVLMSLLVSYVAESEHVGFGFQLTQRLELHDEIDASICLDLIVARDVAKGTAPQAKE